MQDPDYFDILPYGIFLIDGNGFIISVNKAAREILSAPPEFFIKKAIWDASFKFADKSGALITKETHPAVMALGTRSSIGKVLLSYESVDQSRKIWIECSATISNRGCHSSDCNVLMSFNEITEVLEIEERYKAIFELSPFMLVLNDLETNKYVDVNRKFSTITNLDKKTCLGKTPFEMGLILDPKLTDLLREAILNNKAIEQYELPSTNLSMQHTLLFWSQVIEFLGKKYVLTALQDITDRKKVENDLVGSEAKYKKLSEQLAESKAQLRALAAHLQNVREEERIVIAREIHDELGHLLAVMKLDLEECRINWGLEPEKLREKIEPMIELVNSGISSVRRISTELRPGILDHFGLIPALEWHIQQFQLHTKISCTCFFEKESLNLSNEDSSTIFRIVQEIFTNIARHSKADTVQVKMTEFDGHIIFNIKDNGVGFSQTKSSGRISFGILGMKERARSIGAEFNIVSSPGNGTEISLILKSD